MLKRLARKLLVLSVLIAALTAASSAPASSTNTRRFCYDGPITDDCPTGRYCCDLSGNCTCGLNRTE